VWVIAHVVLVLLGAFFVAVSLGLTNKWFRMGRLPFRKIGRSRSGAPIQVEGKALATSGVKTSPFDGASVVAARGVLAVKWDDGKPSNAVRNGTEKPPKETLFEHLPEVLYLGDGSGTARVPLSGFIASMSWEGPEIEERWSSWSQVPEALRSRVSRAGDFVHAAEIEYREHRIAPGDDMHVEGVADHERDPHAGGESYRGEASVLAFDATSENFELSKGSFASVRSSTGCGAGCSWVLTLGMLGYASWWFWQHYA